MMGLSLKGDAMAAVVSFLERAEDANASLSLMLDALDARSLTSSIVDKQVVDETTRALDRAAGVTGVEMDARDGRAAHDRSTHDPDDGITIVDAFEMPKLAYDTQRRTFYEKTRDDATRDATVDAEADSKIDLYRERFKLLQQRIARHRMFTKPSFECGGSRANDATRAYCELTPLTGLLGAAGETRYVMGCLSQLEDDRFFLEDLTGTIQIDLSNAATSSGLFTENCIVVAEGEVRVADGVFEARALGFPPRSRAESALAAAHRDFFGAGRLRPTDIARLLKSEATSTEDMFVVMSDVWLDRAARWRLRAVFEGFDSWTPRRRCSCPRATSARRATSAAAAAPARAPASRSRRTREDSTGSRPHRGVPASREESRWVFVPGRATREPPRRSPGRRSAVDAGRRRSAAARDVRVQPGARPVQVTGPRVHARKPAEPHAARVRAASHAADAAEAGRRRRRRGPAAKAFARNAPRPLRETRATTRASTRLEIFRKTARVLTTRTSPPRKRERKTSLSGNGDRFSSTSPRRSCSRRTWRRCRSSRRRCSGSTTTRCACTRRRTVSARGPRRSRRWRSSRTPSSSTRGASRTTARSPCTARRRARRSSGGAVTTDGDERARLFVKGTTYLLHESTWYDHRHRRSWSFKVVIVAYLSLSWVLYQRPISVSN